MIQVVPIAIFSIGITLSFLIGYVIGYHVD